MKEQIPPFMQEHVPGEQHSNGIGYPQDHCVHTVFAQSAEHNPDAIALVQADTQLSYGELNRRANQLAHYLQQQGVGPEIRVGICLERSLEMVIAIIAVLKAGGCYVPMDVLMPQDRLLYQLHDARVLLLITQAHLVDKLSGCQTELLCIDDHSPLEQRAEITAPQTTVAAEHLMYIIYTSGSTGHPKGTMITHASLCNLALWHIQNFSLHSSDRTTHLAGLGFDASVWELWPPLLAGACITLLEDPVQLAPAQLLHWFAEQAITMSFVPTPLTEQLLLEQHWPASLSLRILLSGGDRLHRVPSPSLPFQLVNNYGPTEATVVATSGVVDPGEQAPDIGRAIANMHSYVLDEQMQAVPPGVEGELYLGGVQLARGYLQQPALTAERFVPHPLSTRAGARLYRTGDVVRFLPNGHLDFVGRNDFQIKVRGYRIEPGEIEHALLRHSSVRECVVVAREDRLRTGELVAYVILHSAKREEQEAVSATLQHAVRERLPEYMVPTAIVVLDAFPLTVNGKVDRHALPAPEAYHMPYGAAHTQIEHLLVHIWSQVLRLPEISIHDNFFALGGDSILGISVIARARQSGLHMTMKQLYQAPTITRLSALITPLASTESEEQPVSQGRLTLTPIQRWFFALHLANPHHWNQAFLFQLPPSLSMPLLQQALHLTFGQHDVFRLRFTQTSQEHWQARYLEGSASIPFSFRDLTDLPEEVQVRSMTALCTAAQASLHIGEGPLARAVLFRLSGPQPYRLLLAIHHLVIDTVSWRVLLEDMTLAYRQLLDHQPLIPLQPGSTFQQWAQRLADYVQTGSIQGEYAFWLQQQQYLERPEHALPVDNPSGENTVASLRTVELTLSREDTRVLLRDVPSRYRATIEEVLLAALALTFHDVFGRSDIVIDMEGHGREELFSDVDLSRTAGWFTSKFPVLLKLGAQPELLDALRRTKALVRQLPQRGIGYGLLRYLHPDPAVRQSLQSAYEPQVSLNYLGQFDQVMGSDALFPLASEASGSAHGPENQRIHRLYILAMIVEDRLHISWQYSAQLQRTETIEHLTRRYLVHLRHSIFSSQQATDEGLLPYIPDDFPLLHSSQPSLDHLLQQICKVRHSDKPVTLARQVQDLYPLSAMQAGLLFHSQVTPGSGLYVVQVNVLIEGIVHLGALLRSWQQLIAAHPILRTSFIGEELPTQVVWQQVPFPLTLVDYSRLSTEEQQQHLYTYQQEDRQRGFVEQHPPLLRLTLFSLGPQQLHLLWSFHHAILDAWSITLLLNEIFARYERLAQGQEPMVPASGSYRDYIAWLQQQDQQTAAQFWHEELRGITEPTPLPYRQTQLSRQAMGNASYGKQAVRLSPLVSTQLRATARTLQVTVNTLVQASWAFVLSRYSGQAEVLFGMVVAGRSPELPGAESIVGLCVNTVPVRLCVPRQEMVGDWLKHIHEQLATIRHYDYYPLVQIQGHSEITPGFPLFDSIFAFENHPGEQLHRGQLRVQRSEDEEQTHYPLAAVVLPGEQLELLLSYQEQLLTQETIAGMLGLWQEVLGVIGQQLEQQVTSLPLLAASEREQMLTVWNASEQVPPRSACAHELFAQQAVRQPDALALVQGDTNLSYGALDRRATHLAHLLRQQGVRPDTLVALCLDRCPELIVAIVAILKAGGAYLPLDISLPPNRLHSLLCDARVSVILTRQHLLALLADAPAPCWSLDQPWTPRSPDMPSLNSYPVHPQNLAYVIYTSGSTGHPKGTMLTHQSLANLLSWHLQTFDLRPTDRSTHLAGLGFDASVWELWPALVAGACVTLLDDPAHLAPEQLVRWLTRHAVTVSFVPTPLLELLLTHPWPTSRALRLLLTGGDRLHRAPAHALPVPLLNNYGPTETTVVATSGPVTHTTGESSPDIGRAIANTQVYLLDEAMEPVPLGCEGEMFLGGVPLARGYLHHPALTAERFVPHPFSRQPGARLYRSGDLARYLPDGRVQFVGRRDFQVKVRGVRIELGEIEQILLAHPAVRECVVCACDDQAGSTQLVAYLVPARQVDEQVSWREVLRAFLREHLPASMLPSHVVMLSALPLTSSGKVDRRALPPAPVEQNPMENPDQQRWHDPVDDLLTDIWQALLPAPHIHAHDNFFALGGHSLLAMQVLARVRLHLGLDLPLRTLFEAPTLAAFSAQVHHHLHATPTTPLPPLRPTARTTPPPLSYAQERLWFLEQLEPGQSTYHIPLILRLHGPLLPTALQASLHTLETRHEVLRLHLVEHEGQTVQGRLPVGRSPLVCIDLRGLAPRERDLYLQQLTHQEAHRPFHLRQGPLWRAHLLHLTTHDWILLLTMHHLIIDGWSLPILLQELGQGYLAHQHHTSVTLPPLPVQYADYACWQRAWIQEAHLDADLAYWRDRLAGLQPLQLPSDHPHPPVRSSRGTRMHLRLPAPLHQHLRAVSRDAGVTLLMTLLTGWLLVLHRYSGQDDLAVGTPIANRTQADLEGLIGFFVNTLVLRCTVQEETPLRDLLAHVREVTLGAYSHGEVPFEHVVQALHPQRELSRSPLFQVMFAEQHDVMPHQSWEEITLQVQEPVLEAAKFDLSLFVQEHAQGIDAWMEYSSDLFEAATITRMLLHWQQALQALVQQPDQRVADIVLLTDEERALLDTWNATHQAYSQDYCEYALFEQWAARQPDALALAQGDAQLSYGALNRRANQLAHRLQRQGVGPDTLVAICLERCLDLVVAIVAVLKAGGAYLPLDSSLPPERLRYQVSDARAGVALTHAPVLEKLAGCPAPVLCLDREWPQIALEADDQLLCAGQMQNLAYVIYTSGSTGHPKGTMLTHQSLANLLSWHLQAFDLRPTDRTAHLAGLGFDASVWELWPALVAGASITLLDDPTYLAPESLVGWFTRHAITVSFVPTPIAERLIEQPWPTICALRVLLTGGDRLHHSPQQTLPFVLINNYGPTEATVVATSGPVTAGRTGERRAPDIGRPIANTQLYVLDQAMQPVPLGVEGELYLGGAQLARGYFDRPELTAERFVPHPLSTQPGARLYRTGDVVRYLCDGRVQFVGRSDFQVKVRGYRIELGEIEQVLLHNPGVREAAVVVHEEEADHQQLVAYVELAHPGEDREDERQAIQGFLQERLPAYMIPAHILLLDALPLTANGKVDYHALPAPRPSPKMPAAAPRTSVEHLLADIWSQVLRLPQVGIHDNFFALGGDSILSLSLVARARQAGLLLTVKQIFQAPTIARLSQLVSRLDSDAAPSTGQRSQGSTPLTPIQHWFFEQHFANPHHWNQALLLQASADLAVPHLQQALHHVLSQHDVFRLRFTPTSPQDWQAHYLPTSQPIPFTVVDLRTLPLAEQTRCLQDRCNQEQACLHLGDGPLARAVLFHLSSTPPWRLLLLSHHLVVDAVSWRILLDDLQQTYTCLQQGDPLPQLTASASFQQWACCLQEAARTETTQQDAAFWLQSARSAPPLPLDHPMGDNCERSVQQIEQHLSQQATRALLRDVPRLTRATVEEVLLTALALACADRFGLSAVAIDLESHGRQELDIGLDLSRVVGWCTTLAPFVLDVGPQPEPLLALRTIKAGLRRLPRRGIGYGLLRYLHPDAALRARMREQPRPALSFNYLGQFDQPPDREATFTLASTNPGNMHAPENQRAHPLDVVALIMGEQLHLSWLYSAQLHRTQTILQLAEAYETRLRQLISFTHAAASHQRR
jgi:amino acid adenylation domain-containing protein/non-ribosomal peptide synthase protein (TIGR01720 family)